MTTEDETQALTGQILCMPWVKKFRITAVESGLMMVQDHWFALVRGDGYNECLEHGSRRYLPALGDELATPPAIRLALLKMAVATLGKLQEAA